MASLTCSEHLGLSVGGETSLLLQTPLSPCVSHHSAVLVWLHGGSWLSKRIGSLWQPQSCTVSRLPYSFDQSKSQGQPKFKWKMDSTPRLEEHHDCPGNVNGHLFAEKLLQWLTASKLLQIPSLSKLTLDNHTPIKINFRKTANKTKQTKKNQQRIREGKRKMVVYSINYYFCLSFFCACAIPLRTLKPFLFIHSCQNSVELYIRYLPFFIDSYMHIFPTF